MKDGPCSSFSHPSPLALPFVRSCGKDWAGSKEQPYAYPGFSGVCPLHHHSQGCLIGWHARQDTVMCLSTRVLPKYLSTQCVQASRHCNSSYSTDTTVCFLWVSDLPLNYSPNLQQHLRPDRLLNGDLGKIFLQKLMSHGVTVVPGFPCLRGL